MAIATEVPTAADLRARIARERVLIFRVAARLGLHPARVSRILHERLPLSPEMAEALVGAIDAEARERLVPATRS